MKPGKKIDLHETEKSHIALRSHLSKYLHVLEIIWNSDQGRFYIGIISIANSTPDMSCSAHVVQV